MRIGLGLGALSVILVGCPAKDDPVDSDEPAWDVSCADVERANCVEISGGDSQALQDAANSLEDDTALVLGEGTFELDNALTLRGANGVTVIGQGKDVTTLDFASVAAQANGIDAIANDIHIEGLTVVDSKKDAIRIEDSDGVVLRSVKVTWSAGPVPENGAYGIYPVKVQHVLIEDSEAYNASDAGIYVGQCQHAIVRNNVAMQNVAGIEIENTQYADVYGNTAEDNTAGLLIFDLPGNPIIGHDIKIHDNTIVRNNRENFAPGGVVAVLPAGVGTFAMASRVVEITGNEYTENNTFDIAAISGLVIEGDPEQWHLTTSELVGNTEGFDLPTDSTGIYNYKTYDVYVHGNTHTGSGTDPDLSNDFGLLFGFVFQQEAVDSVLYDAIGESAFSADNDDSAGNSNDNRICVGADISGFASLDLANLAEQAVPNKDMIYRPPSPFAPFDCVGVTPELPTGIE